MNIVKGFQVERPNVFVEWGISKSRLEQLFQTSDLRPVANDYYVASCTSLKGLSHELGFHFDPRPERGLVELEFFGIVGSDIDSSFQEFQSHLVKTFGHPTETKSGTEDYPTYIWDFEGVNIAHYVQERFGPAESVRIKWSPEESST
jgi:hypothetical protein